MNQNTNGSKEFCWNEISLTLPLPTQTLTLVSRQTLSPHSAQILQILQCQSLTVTDEWLYNNRIGGYQVVIKMSPVKRFAASNYLVLPPHPQTINHRNHSSSASTTRFFCFKCVSYVSQETYFSYFGQFDPFLPHYYLEYIKSDDNNQ